MQRQTIGIDLAKNVFELAISKRPGKVHQRRRLSRARLLPFFAQCEPSVVVMEACGSAHSWGRALRDLGHQPRLLPPSLVKPYVVRNKSDRADAEALLEAHRNRRIREVPVKTLEQQNLAAMHRMRAGWISTRVQQINRVRAILRELGLFIPQGAHRVAPQVHEWLADDSIQIAESTRILLLVALEEIRSLEHKQNQLDKELERMAKGLPVVQRLLSIPGVGIVTATALWAWVGDVERFRSCRAFANYLGLTPREYSSGQKRRLGPISRQGNDYLRTLLVHGARSILRIAQRHPDDPLCSWAVKLRQRAPHNKAAVGVANKLARIAYAVWKHERLYQRAPLASL
jgi:transposase